MTGRVTVTGRTIDENDWCRMVLYGDSATGESRSGNFGDNPFTVVTDYAELEARILAGAIEDGTVVVIDEAHMIVDRDREIYGFGHVNIDYSPASLERYAKQLEEERFARLPVDMWAPELERPWTAHRGRRTFKRNKRRQAKRG